ncbi:hypothetical protein OIU77_027872 [Salix suchowensis]|uniref:H(+)-exporting diphosphatase n=1 Tax=Salix suchowensis TaxID=1278906 RepID=A0ABQ9BR58_9ROSI|nr:hypothetical protein OIU77_027872 [Salix suchowensis]
MRNRLVRTIHSVRESQNLPLQSSPLLPSCSVLSLRSSQDSYPGLKIATFDNARTALEARKRVGKAFITAFRFGAVMGSLLAANGISADDVLNPKVFIGPIVGAMLPSSLILFHGHIEECGRCTRQLNTIPGLKEGQVRPDCATCQDLYRCIIKEMIPPGALAMLTPLIDGIFSGNETLSGFLAGSLVSRVRAMIFLQHMH